MKKIRHLKIAAALLATCGTIHPVFAEESETPQKLEHAVWLEPQAGQAPWADTRSTKQEAPSYRIKASCPAFALIESDDKTQITVVDKAMHELGSITLPENTQWYTVDEKGRIFAHDGSRLYVAQNWEDGVAPEGYQSVLDIPNVRALDVADEHVIFADGASLHIVDLNTGVLKKIALSDFMDVEKSQAMTPESVQAAEEKAQKSKKSSKSAQKSKKDTETSDSEQSTQIADIQGIWWRADGTGVIRVKSLLNTKTFITTDNGRSWRQSNDSPKTLTHSFGWIWDENDRILSKDGNTWIQVTGPRVSPTDRWTTTHSIAIAPALPEQWLYQESPVLPVQAQESEGAESQESPDEAIESQAPQLPTIVEIAIIPQASTQAVSETELPVSQSLYTPTQPKGGMQIGFFRDAECSNGASECGISELNPPSAWMVSPERGFESISLPEGCIPAYAASSLGLGLLMCYAENDEYLVYVRTADTDWQAETLLPPAIGNQPEILTAEDGTLILLGQCGDETVELPVMPTEEEMAQGLEPRTETRTTYVCNAAVRLPEEIGQPEIWRMEHMENAHGFVPLNGGRLLSVEGQSSAQRKLTLRTAQTTEVIVDQFDATAYTGIVSTNEGCLALYDGSIPEVELRSDFKQQVNPETGEATDPLPVKLLSSNGKLAQMDCSSSRAVAELASSRVTEYEEAPGDDRYGLRASAGGFFTTQNVKTWNARVEVLIPIFEGHYEVGLMYRMAGGNTASALGHIGLVSIRWRYDQFEKFDFAVGAGIGYGTMCGYDESADPAANDDDDNTLPSGYSECNRASIRYLLGGIASYKFAEKWKVFISAEMLGGTNWSFDLTGGLEIRF